MLALLFSGIAVSAYASGDPNDYIGRLSDLEFSNSREAVFLNDVFIKSAIGIDVGNHSVVTKIIKEKCNDTLVINGIRYTDKLMLFSDKNINFVSLEDVRKEFCSEVTGPCLYMINKFFIAKDVAAYKIDKDFITKVEILPSSEIELFNDQKPFTIIRIFTNTENNNYQMRIQ